MVAHDLGNPLTAIRVIAEILREDAVDDSTRRDAKDLLEAADLASAIVEGMGSLLQLEGKASELTWFPIDLVQVLRTATDRPMLRRRLRLQLPPELHLAGDRRALGRAFSDVFVNALRIAAPPEEVHVTAKTAGEFVEVRVDHGSGDVPAELRSLLVEPYGPVRLRRKKIPALASGLAFAESIFSRHGGGLALADGPRGGLEVVCTLAR